MKKTVLSLVSFLILACYAESAYVGKVYFKPRPGDATHQLFRVPASFLESPLIERRGTGKAESKSEAGGIEGKDADTQLAELQAYVQSEKTKGNLKIRLVQDDPLASMQHNRYTQYYRGLEVFGGEIIEHYKAGQLSGINGEYYEIGDLDTVPFITKETAIELFSVDLGKLGLAERQEESAIIVYPVRDGDYRLAYRVVLEQGMQYSMTGIVSAATGQILLKYSNIQTGDFTIGKGVGHHGETYKFPTTFKDNVYWLYDEHNARPVNQYTYVYDLLIRTYDSDNYWDLDRVGVNVHTYAGWTYDYYFLAHGRRGIDDNDMNLRSVVHAEGGNDNANWHPYYLRMAFYDPGLRGWQTGAALDCVAHEYSHGVTQFSSNLTYQNQSGALNESFSDIMATAVESYYQSPGSGFNEADWLIGEDVYDSYGTSNCLRNLVDPNAKENPCHLTQIVTWPDSEQWDWGGVHQNSTLYAHAYYLLANGGTNKVSGKSVSGIGIEKATRIFYRAWTYWMTSTSNFWNAANYLLWSASNLYGSSGNEYTQTIRMLEAIGYTVY